MFDEYIDELIKNIPKREIPHNLDIVVEGGAFNGSYVLGILFFLKRMEEHNLIKVKKMSGCSVGGLLCFKYLTDSLDESLLEYNLLRKSFYKNQNFKILHKSLDKNIEKLTPENFEKIQKRLFLTFHTSEKQIIQSEYDNTEDLKKALLKTAHLPILSNGELYLKDKGSFFLDGLLPYIFKDRSESINHHILYISPNSFSKLKNMFITKNEISTYGRVSEGILDVYSFFFNKKQSEMCSFVNKWSISSFISLRIKHLLIILFLYTIRAFSHISHKILPYLKQNELYNNTEPIVKNMFSDIFLYNCF